MMRKLRVTMAARRVLEAVRLRGRQHERLGTEIMIGARVERIDVWAQVGLDV